MVNEVIESVNSETPNQDKIAELLNHVKWTEGRSVTADKPEFDRNHSLAREKITANTEIVDTQLAIAKHKHDHGGIDPVTEKVINDPEKDWVTNYWENRVGADLRATDVSAGHEGMGGVKGLTGGGDLQRPK